MYSLLVVGADEKAREKFDRDLYAPADGWDAVQRRLYAIAAEEG